MIKKIIFEKSVILFSFLWLTIMANSQTDNIDPVVENEYNTWVSLSVSKKINKYFKVYINSEIRLDQDFQWNKFLTDVKLKYKPVKYFDLAAGYRLNFINTEKDKNEFSQRLFFDLSTSIKVTRFEPELRVRYTNDSEFGSDDTGKNYLRYKCSIDYDIKKSKITPCISAEAFHSINNREINVIRYRFGAQYKVNSHGDVNLDYTLDYFLTKYKNKHILGLSYNFKF